MRALRWTAAVASVALVLGGCGDDDATDGDATTTTEVAVPEPEVGECRGPIDQTINAAETDSRPTVPCDQPHGSETAAVLDLPEDLQDATHDEAVAGFDSDEPPFDDLLAQCIDATDELCGSDPSDVRPGHHGRPVRHLDVPPDGRKNGRREPAGSDATP